MESIGGYILSIHRRGRSILLVVISNLQSFLPQVMRQTL